MFLSSHLEMAKTLDVLGLRDQHLPASVPFGAMPVHVPAMHWWSGILHPHLQYQRMTQIRQKRALEA